MRNIKLVILYGSHAKGTAGKNSDIDVAVLSDRPLTTEEMLQLLPEVAEEFDFHPDQLQLVDLWSAPPLLRYEAAKHGKLLKGDELDFKLLKIRAWKQYQDTAKLRQWKKEHLRERIYGK